jgi:6-phosphogluconolactonase
VTAFILPNALVLYVLQNAEMQAIAVAQRIAVVAQQAIATRGICRIALAGGETPRRSYEQLRNMPIDWTHVHIYFGDERCLPVGDAQRNDTMAQHTLLQHVAIPTANVHSIPAELGAQAAASRYALELEQALPLDLVLLGMGEDGHTASLFPGNPALRIRESVAAVFDAPKPPPDRVTLSMATLNAARRKIILVAGSGKRIALQRIAQGETLPAGQVTEAEWYVDQAALPSG